MDEETRNLIKYGQRKRPCYVKQDDGGLSWWALIAIFVLLCLIRGCINAVYDIPMVSW